MNSTRDILDEQIGKPKFYSRQGIFIVSLLSSIFGSILFSINLYRIGKKKEGIGSVFLIITVFCFLYKILSFEGFVLMKIILLNLIGGIIIIFPLWNQHVDKSQKFVKASIVLPLLLFFTVIIGILLVNFWVKG